MALGLTMGGCGQRPAGPRPDAAYLRALVVAAGGRRPLEPRLTGGFAYASCQAGKQDDRLIPLPRCAALPRPGGHGFGALERAASHLRTRARAHPSGRALHAEGLADLMLAAVEGATQLPLADPGPSSPGKRGAPHPEKEGPIEKAIAQLAKAAAEAPAEARIWSDLAAAHLARAQQRDDPYELMPALVAANRAVAASGLLPEARFNRALILEKLFLVSDAREAWRDYLRLDARSPWAAEATAHLAALDPPVPDPRNGPEQLEEAVRAGRTDVVRRIVLRDPQALREHAESLLTGWAEARAHGDAEKGGWCLAVARAIGAALAETTEERLVWDAVGAIDRASASQDKLRLDRLARGHRRLRQGYNLYRKSQPDQALVLLNAARRDLARGGSPFAAQAAFWAAVSEHHLDRYTRSFSSLVRIEREITGLSYPCLMGHLAWMKGVSHLVRGNPVEALGFYSAALPYFERTRESANAAAVHILTAESLEYLGRNRESWRHRYLALRASSTLSNPRRLLLIFQVMADSALRQGEAGIALSFQREAVRGAELEKNPALLADALAWRGLLRHQLGDSEGARGDLEAARRTIARGGDRTVRRRIEAGIALIQGEIEVATHPRRAIPLLTSSLGFYAHTGHDFYKRIAHRARAQAYRRLGHAESAEADLLAGIGSYERQGERLREEEQRLAFLEQTWSLFDEMVAFQAEDRHAPWRAFEYQDLALTRVLPGLTPQLQIQEAERRNLLSREPLPSTLAEIQRRLPAGTTLVQYSVLPDRLLLWLVQPHHRAFFVAKVTPDTLARLVSRARDRDAPGRAAASAALYDLLVRPWRDAVTKGESLVFVPDKMLQGTPFAALEEAATRRYLVEDHRIVVAPSATLYRNALDRRPGKGAGGKRLSALAVGDPAFDRVRFGQLRDLPAAGEEAADIAALFPGARLLRNGQADKATFLALAPLASLIHFGGHALTDGGNPLLSRLVFAPGKDGDPGALYAREIYQLRLGETRLVVLAACDTAGPMPDSAGVASLARAFLAAGVPAVVASLWSVDDRATATLFQSFYRELRGGADPATALRDAQLALLRGTGPERSPAAWGAFEVLGGSAP
jgi:CHAT domain-containing protein